jgi:hypothetical protein
MEQRFIVPYINEMEQWLIRTAKNWIAGPYPKEQICKMIMDGSLGLQDEVCPANGYWILIHERKEIFNQLGVQVPRSSEAEDEVTENEIPVDELEKPKPSSANPVSTTFLAQGAPSALSSQPPEDEKIETHKGLAFIILGIGLLLIIALRAFKH